MRFQLRPNDNIFRTEFFLWGYLKNKVYMHNIYNENDLKPAMLLTITREINAINNNIELLHRVNDGIYIE